MELIDMKQGWPAMEPYLLPEYWDNHHPGDGDALLITKEEMSVKAFGDFVRDSLQTYLRRERTRTALQSYDQDDTFDANEHNPGTVVAYAQETLFIHKPHHVPAPRVGLQVPERPSLLPPDTLDFVGGSKRLIADEKNGLSYFQWNRWGVVAERPTGEHIVVSPAVSLVMDGGTPRAAVMARRSMSYLPSPLTAGVASHYRNEAGSEMFERIGVLEVLTSGDAPR